MKSKIPGRKSFQLSILKSSLTHQNNQFTHESELSKFAFLSQFNFKEDSFCMFHVILYFFIILPGHYSMWKSYNQDVSGGAIYFLKLYGGFIRNILSCGFFLIPPSNTLEIFLEHMQTPDSFGPKAHLEEHSKKVWSTYLLRSLCRLSIRNTICHICHKISHFLWYAVTLCSTN